jgi:excisionase family DNA binding protein
MASVAFNSKKSSAFVEQQYADFRSGDTRIITPDGAAQTLPPSLRQFFKVVSGQLVDSKSVTLVRGEATFTTAKAADLLGVSRQFLVNLLEKGEIAFHKVGTHRRIYAQDLFRYKAARDRRRHRLIRGLARAEAREGIYDKIPYGAG